MDKNSDIINTLQEIRCFQECQFASVGFNEIRIYNL